MNGLGGSCDAGVDPLRTMLEAAKFLDNANSNPWKATEVRLFDFDAKEGFNFAEEILEFLALFASGPLEELSLTGFHPNASVSITHEGFFKKLPDLESLWVSSYAYLGGLSLVFLEVFHGDLSVNRKQI